MTAKQKLIKYLALAFAVFLIVSFALGIFEILSSLLEMEVKKPIGTESLYSYSVSDTVSELEISISAADLKIITGDAFCISTDNDNITCHENGSLLTVEDKERFSLSPGEAVLIEVPADKSFDKITLNAGAGEVTVDILNTAELSMNFGAGDFFADTLFVTAKAYINCAAGEVTVNGGTVNNLEMNTAIGDVALACSLKGKTEIDCAVGDVSLDLPDSLSEYSIKLDKGICSASLNGENMEDEKRYGDGFSRIEIDGAVGDIRIKTNG